MVGHRIESVGAQLFSRDSTDRERSDYPVVTQRIGQ